MSLKVKRVLTHVLCFVLGAVIGAGIYGAVDNIPKTDVSGEFMTDSSGGGLVIKDTEANGIKLTSVAIPVAQYADYGISPIAESAQTIIATTKPVSSGSASRVEWSAAWENGSSSWAQGKQVESYIKLTPGGDYNKTLTVECLQAFGEKIVVTCQLAAYPELQATVDLHYLKRVSSADITLGDIVNVRYSGQTVVRAGVGFELTRTEKDSHHGGQININPTFSIGTLDVNVSVTLKGSTFFRNRTTINDTPSILRTTYFAFGKPANSVGSTWQCDVADFVPFDFSSYDVKRNGLYFTYDFFCNTFQLCAGTLQFQDEYGTTETYCNCSNPYDQVYDYWIDSGAINDNSTVLSAVVSYKNEEFGAVSTSFEVQFYFSDIYDEGASYFSRLSLSTDKDKMYF